LRSGNKCAQESTGGIEKSEARVKERDTLKQTATEPEGELAEVEEIIESIQESLSSDDPKPSVLDLVRLLELRRELVKPQTARMTVRWIDECQQTPVCGE
jgi:hypothetical protein